MKLLTPEEVSQWLHVSISALTNMRSRSVRDPIPFVKVGRQVLYPEHLVLKWIERHTFHSNQEYFESKTG